MFLWWVWTNTMNTIWTNTMYSIWTHTMSLWLRYEQRQLIFDTIDFRCEQILWVPNRTRREFEWSSWRGRWTVPLASAGQAAPPSSLTRTPAYMSYSCHTPCHSRRMVLAFIVCLEALFKDGLCTSTKTASVHIRRGWDYHPASARCRYALFSMSSGWSFSACLPSREGRFTRIL